MSSSAVHRKTCSTNSPPEQQVMEKKEINSLDFDDGGDIGEALIGSLCMMTSCCVSMCVTCTAASVTSINWL